MNRDRATGLLAEMLDRLAAGAGPLNLVEEIHLFGSYIRGALEPGDVEAVVQHTTDDRWLRESPHASINGRDPYVSIRQALRGNRRGISLQFQEGCYLQDEGIPCACCDEPLLGRRPGLVRGPAGCCPPASQHRPRHPIRV